MTSIGTPLSDSSTRLMLLGSGELGKEVAIEAQRLGVEVIAVDRYANAPAMQVAHRSHVLNMLDGDALHAWSKQEQPDFIVPEVEAIATSTLAGARAGRLSVIPDCQGHAPYYGSRGHSTTCCRRVAPQDFPYRFADKLQDYRAAVAEIGLPCVVKPVMSSSGHGQSTLRDEAGIDAAWNFAQADARGGAGKVIVEGFVDFDYEITLLTVRHSGQTSFCMPIGHRQVNGDYRESWQPHPMSERALENARQMAGTITGSLGGDGLFGVELFVKGDEVVFSEVSPRPHDTGMVTMISQNLSEFALHVRAILGLPIPQIEQHGPAASCVILAEGESSQPLFLDLEKALALPATDLRLFGKPEIHGHRRMGVALALGDDIVDARAKAARVAAAVVIKI